MWPLSSPPFLVLLQFTHLMHHSHSCLHILSGQPHWSIFRFESIYGIAIETLSTTTARTENCHYGLDKPFRCSTSNPITPNAVLGAKSTCQRHIESCATLPGQLFKKSLPGNLSEFSGVQQSNFPAFPAEKKLKWFSDFYHLITRLKYQIILKNCLCDNKRKRKTLHFTWQTTNWWSCSKGRKRRKSFIFIRTTRRETLFKIWLCFQLDFLSVNIPYKDE